MAETIVEAVSERALAGQFGICLIHAVSLDNDGLNADVERAKTVAQIGALASASPRILGLLRSALETPAVGRTFDGPEAAERLGMTDKDGKPSDRFYKVVAPKIGWKDDGGRWIIREENVESYRRGALQ